MERLLRLVNRAGSEVDAIRFSAKRELPDVIVWGVNEKQKTFLRDKGDTYREVSFMFYVGDQSLQGAFGSPLNR